ncbi:MAG TPA: MBL fold metallo-hydrolase [Candidatus Acidoferrum sp.]|nr:MBL fold metallo-hydrolase [Candidatus Acidoferrum sp.]
MKLKVLVENNTYIDVDAMGEPGLCFYIEEGGKKLLLDTGITELYRKNAQFFGVDLSGVTSVVISHGHYDHTNGLKDLMAQPYAQNIELVAHPAAFAHKQLESGLDIGSQVTRSELEKVFRLTLTKEPYWLTDRLVFLGEIPRIFDFENREPINLMRDMTGRLVPDPLADDTALAYKGEAGVYVITGCSHSGVCNIIERAKRVCGDDRVAGVIGGFHLFGATGQLSSTIDYLSSGHIGLLAPCHCVNFPAKAAIHARLPVEEVAVGYEVIWR